MNTNPTRIRVRRDTLGHWCHCAFASPLQKPAGVPKVQAGMRGYIVHAGEECTVILDGLPAPVILPKGAIETDNAPHHYHD
jgi:hypothetical protein